MSNGCHQCRKPFGLVRRGIDFGIGAFKVRVIDNDFCSDSCESNYRKARQQEQRVFQFLQWLHARPP